LIQIATQVFHSWIIPNWVVQLVIVVVTIGFSLAIIIAWAFELTPEVLKRTEVADAWVAPSYQEFRARILVRFSDTDDTVALAVAPTANTLWS
jgi:hypothetical protein